MANPPITIGALTNVPAPGSPIASAWAQDVTRRVVHQFATSAARDAQFTSLANGSLAYTVDYGRLCMWDGFGWVILRESPTTVPAGSPTTAVWPHSSGASSTQIGVTSTWASGTTVQARYMRAAGLCHIGAIFTLTASGFSIGQLNLPFPFDATSNLNALNVSMAGNQVCPGMLRAWGGLSMAIFAHGISGAAVITQSCTATFPFTWKATDVVSISGSFALSNHYDAFYMNP